MTPFQYNLFAKDSFNKLLQEATIWLKIDIKVKNNVIHNNVLPWIGGVQTEEEKLNLVMEAVLHEAFNRKPVKNIYSAK